MDLKKSRIILGIIISLFAFASCDLFSKPPAPANNTKKVVLFSSTNELVMSSQLTEDEEKLQGITAFYDGETYTSLSGAAIFTMEEEADGKVSFSCNSRYLSSTGNSLVFTKNKGRNALWILEEVDAQNSVYNIKNGSAKCQRGQEDVPAYVKCYNGIFTTADKNSNTNTSFNIQIVDRSDFKIISDLHDEGIVYMLEESNYDPKYSGKNYPEDSPLYFGNPSKATDNPAYSKNYLMEKTTYALSYNNKSHNSNWVAWHLEASDMGAQDRSDNFRADKSLPAFYYRVTENDYKNSGYDKGHMCPSGDRTSTKAVNSETFLMTNMIAQSANNNQKVWLSLETYLRNTAASGNEVYIFAGPAGIGGSGNNGSNDYLALGSSLQLSSEDKGIVVPESTWKIALIMEQGTDDAERVTAATKCIAINVPNNTGCLSDAASAGYNEATYWQHYAVSVDEIEELTGFDFFANLPDEIEDAIESRVVTQ